MSVAFHSEALRYRPLEMRDLDSLMKWENAPEDWQFGERQLPVSESLLHEYILSAGMSLEEAGQYRWMIERIEDSKPVGLLDLFDLNIQNQRAAVGIYIDPDYRQAGYGVEALLWLANYAQRVGLLHQLFAYVPKSNPASNRLFERAGFERTGQLTDWYRTENGYSSVIQYQKLF